MKRRLMLVDVGGVLAAWLVLLALENLVVGIAYRDQFSGSWEMAHARWYLTPLALGASFPIAAGFVVVGRLFAARNARALAALGALAGVVVALGVSTGRHMASWAVRAPFVLVVAAAAGATLHLLARRAPLERPKSIAAAGAVIAALAWLADAFVLPRLYPAFHAGLLAVTLGAFATTWLVVGGLRARVALSTIGLAVTLYALATTSRAANAVKGDDNLRRVLSERAPLLGRAVVLAARVAPPPPLDDGAAETEATSAAIKGGAATHALDWRGHDVVLVTIDALRADHVSSYGYGRATTPNIDKLAARGARFSHAYCPTPHTSYSVTSMMTGKYMRPLLAMGTGEDSETWATYMRRYGFRTAAFYPPAVFFIDQHRFERFEREGLGFEYRKVEFAKPELRKKQIEGYLETGVPRDMPLFLWVHIFEPHEPYEAHPDHPFTGDEKTDAYDSEIATADALVGDIVTMVDKRRPGAVIVVSADHGEEFGDHGGRYHGTTVYEEQIRVPLVVVGPGIAPRVVATPVQTIDLLPTTLSALDIPLPARVRGRDLGAILAGKPPPDEGLAFAETDDWTALARGSDRLVCARKIGGCTLFDVAKDPLEVQPVTDRAARAQELRRLTAAIERENGKMEGTALPEAIRRCLQGDRDAAEDVAPLFDDARVDIRRAAARCGFALRAAELRPALTRALAKDEDAEVTTWSALALYRLGGEGADAPRVEATYAKGAGAVKLAAALALAERGDARGEGELVARWDAAFVPGTKEAGELDEARELLAAFGTIKSRAAVPSLVRSLEDVRLRPYVVDTLGTIRDPRAKAPLLAAFTGERYVDVRPKEASALVLLGAKDELRAPLARFAGVPEPAPAFFAIASANKLLDAAHGGGSASDGVETTVRLEGPAGPARLWTSGPSKPEVTVNGAPAAAQARGDGTWFAEVPDVAAGAVRVRIAGGGGAHDVWLVRRTPEIPPPPPKEWDAGAE